MAVSPGRLSKLALLALLALLLRPATAAAQGDEVVFSAYVPPNVLLVLDNSLSMNEIVWHPDFDPNAVYSCTAFPRDDLFFVPNKLSITVCGNDRDILDDNKLGNDTIYRGSYLNWLFSDEADAAYLEYLEGSNGTPSSCSGGSDFSLYQRAKLTAAKRALQDIICEVNLTTKFRVGAATFREPELTTPDVNGGYVIQDVEEYSSTQASDINNAFSGLNGGTWSPLGETIFQLYTYFMGRTNSGLPVGQDGVTKFPAYLYAKDGDSDPSGGKTPPSPVLYPCQKNFIILVSSGEPTRDDFVPADVVKEAAGFADFDKLIGNYNADLEVELQDDKYCLDCQTAMYLDDIAYYMAQNDFRPDMEGDQLIDLYTISLSDNPDANDLLERAAQLGNGTFSHAGNPDEMAQSIIDAFNSIIAKAQSFTAATVPASRTSDGGQIYVSQFVPSETDPYWIGHLKSYQITAAGEILDKNGDCALDDPTPGQCFSGQFKSSAQPYWNVFDKMPSPGARNLSASSLASGSPGKVPFDDTITDLDLGIVFPTVEVYPGSSALNANGIKDEIVANVRGCRFGTGVLSADVSAPLACEPRPALQNDIFHSNPIVVGPPATYDPDPSYTKFASNYATRDRVIMAGSNGGFLQGFLAGKWDTTLSPPAYNPDPPSGLGGREVFGFMPWPARQNIRFKPIDTGGRDYYFVDGSPTVSDVWLYTDATTAPKRADGTEWKTVVVGGMRQGGEAYYALDVTDPQDADYPKYMWEFPSENAAASLKQFVGDTWSQPVLTRIKLQVNGNDNGGAGYERWVMVVAGGYDESSDPNNAAAYDPNATKGRGLFIIDVKTGQVIAQQLFDPTAPLGDPRLEMVYAIPSSPGVFDLDFDGFADVIYVGDLGGNLWKWVIHPIGFDRVNGSGSPDDQPNWKFRKLFSAPIDKPSKGVSLHYKSFFFPPVATFKNGKLWLAFASGERANLGSWGSHDNGGDPVPGSDLDNNRFYALKDGDPLETDVTAQTLADEDQMLELDDSKGDLCADISAYRGYYFIGGDGEKFIVNLELFLGYVFVGSFFPTDPLAGDVCGVRGQGFLAVFRIDCGEGLFTDSSGDPEKTISLGRGLPTDPRVTVSGGGNTSSGSAGQDPTRVIINRQDGELVNIEPPEGFSTFGMFYWREVYQ